MDVPKVAILGTGFMARTHADALRRLGADLIGVLGSSDAKTQQACVELGAKTGYGNLDEVLSDDRVEAVHVTLPNHLHFEATGKLLQAGKHVLCEKPLALTTAETRQLLQLANTRQDLVVGVNYNIRFYPLCLEMRHRCKQESLGRLFHANGSYVQDWLLREDDYNWRVDASQGGSLRAIADIGTHWLDLMQFVTGRQVTELYADLQIVHTERKRPLRAVETFQDSKAQTGQPTPVSTEDYGSVSFRMDDQSHGSFWVSQVTAGKKNSLRLELAAANQSLAWDSELPNQLWIGNRDRPNESLLRDPALMSPAAERAALCPGGHNEGFQDTFYACFRDFYRSVRDRSYASDVATFADGHREAAICEAILASHQSRGWVEITSDEPNPPSGQPKTEN